VLELRKSIGFAGKVLVGFESLLRVDEMIDHLFDRAGTARKALVARQVNHPHAAATQQPLNFVSMLKDDAGLERPG
jgi:hypothetical protein